jgi:dolichyl-phosphate beta-glucosyltransferase
MLPPFSLVIPAFNEEDRIEKTVRQCLRYLETTSPESELIVINDGSTDATPLVVTQIFAERTPVAASCLNHFPNRGKGAAVRQGLLAASKPIGLFSDADLSTPIEELEKLQLALDKGAGIAIASRALRASRVEVSQPIYRVVMGKAFNLIVQAVLLPGIWDTQCGFKLFRADVAHRVFGGLVTDGFGYDPEVLYRARKQGVKIAEVPVVWRDSAPTKVSPVSSSFDMLKHVVRIRFMK